LADRYWVGGTGTWSSSNTTNWSASSGGAGGASVPTAADNVFFDAGSDAGGTFMSFWQPRHGFVTTSQRLVLISQ
jgi:hypothetical protein